MGFEWREPPQYFSTRSDIFLITETEMLSNRQYIFLNKEEEKSVFMYELSFVLTFNRLNSLLLRTMLFDFHLRRETWELR